MFDRLRSGVLRLMRVPPDPDPPAGAPGSLRVFRAGRNLYYIGLVRWGLGQAGALAGIVFSLVFLAGLEDRVEQARAELRKAAAQRPAATTSPQGTGQPDGIPETAAAPNNPTTPEPAAATPTVAVDDSKTAKAKQSKKQRRIDGLTRLAGRWPGWIFPLLTLLEWIGVFVYLAQIPITYAMVRLDYELRWYMVTDRSLRIRAGIAAVQETTMSFANVQQVVVSEGPLQRLLKIADVRVQSAGGGGDQAESGGHSLHTGIFHGVDNAPEIRDLILERLRRFRATGLGDPDDARDHRSPTAVSGALEAAREALAEARALRRTAARTES